jgi:hypothetical protein
LNIITQTLGKSIQKKKIFQKNPTKVFHSETMPARFAAKKLSLPCAKFAALFIIRIFIGKLSENLCQRDFYAYALLKNLWRMWINGLKSRVFACIGDEYYKIIPASTRKTGIM